MTIIITDKEDDIPSEHLLLTDSVANHLMMVQTGTYRKSSFYPFLLFLINPTVHFAIWSGNMQNIKLARFAKIIIRNNDSTLPFVVWQSNLPNKIQINGIFRSFKIITDHKSRPSSLPFALPSLKRKIMYGGEKGDPFPLFLPCLKSKL